MTPTISDRHHDAGEGEDGPAPPAAFRILGRGRDDDDVVTVGCGLGAAGLGTAGLGTAGLGTAGLGRTVSIEPSSRSSVVDKVPPRRPPHSMVARPGGVYQAAVTRA